MHHFLTFLRPLRGTMHHFLRGGGRYIQPSRTEIPTTRGGGEMPRRHSSTPDFGRSDGCVYRRAQRDFSRIWHEIPLKTANFSGPQGLRNDVPEAHAPFLIPNSQNALGGFLMSQFLNARD